MSNCTESLSTIGLQDVGILVKINQDDQNNRRLLLRQGLLFWSKSIQHANDQDNRVLREELKIRTIVDTRHPGTRGVRYYRDYSGGPSSYKTEDYFTEKILGLTSCHVHLRLDAFNRKRVKELPMWAGRKLDFKARTAPTDPKTIAYATELMAQTRKGAVDEGFDLLQAAADVIRRLFNEIVSAPNAFPLLVCSDGGWQDDSIVIFLLLMLLDVPEPAIESAIPEVVYAKPSDRSKNPQTEKSSQDGHTGGQTHWTKGLKQRLEKQYGSVAGYFRAAGVAEAAKNTIREALLSAVSEKSDFLIDIEVE